MHGLNVIDIEFQRMAIIEVIYFQWDSMVY